MNSIYDVEDVKILRACYDFADVNTWPYYPIVIPLKDGEGPVSDAECDTITWEVWDRYFMDYGSYTNLTDAINRAMKMNKDLL